MSLPSLLPPELHGRRIAVTGASDMIGAYLCRSLLRAGAEVIGVVRNPDKAAHIAQPSN